MRVDEPKNPHPESSSKIMASLCDHLTICIDYQTVVANGTGWSLKIFTDYPRNIFPIPFILFRIIDISMFAFTVDIPGGDIRF